MPVKRGELHELEREVADVRVKIGKIENETKWIKWLLTSILASNGLFWFFNAANLLA